MAVFLFIMMIKISENIQLKEVLNTDFTLLFNLMKEIYPQAYKHYWLDSGDWYLNSQYSKKQLNKELLQENAEYYFILYKDEIIGNFRIVWDETLEGLSEEKQVKLHRIYLHQKTHGKGFGKKLLAWLEKKAKQKNYQIIWLDAMDCQTQAFQFYKNLGFQYHSHFFLPFDLMYKNMRKISQLYKKLI